MDRDRRRFLAVAAGVGGTLAGCSSRRDGGLELDALDVAGSPGGTVGVAPAERVVVLDFFATWCAPCEPQMDHLRRVRARFGEGTYLLSISSEQDRDAVRSFWREHRGTWPVALDPDLRATERYGVRRLPTLLVLGPDGEERWRHVGLAADGRIRREIERAAGG